MPVILAVILSLFSGLYAVEGVFQVGEYIHTKEKIKGGAFLVGTHITVDGVVEGDLIALAADVTINGKVLGDVTVIAGQAVLKGEIGGRANLLTANVVMPEEGFIGKGLFLLGGYGEVANTIQGNVLALVGGLTLDGKIGGSVRTFVGKLAIGPKALIQGRVKYRSNQEGVVAAGAQVAGGMQYVAAPLKSLLSGSLLSSLAIGSKIVTFLMNFIYTFGMGALFLRFFPQNIERTLKVLRAKTLQSLLAGLSLLFLLPLVSMILLISIVGVPFAVMLIAFNVFSFYTVKILSILWCANALFRRIGWKENTMKALLTGQIIYSCLVALPIVGWFISLCFMLLGLGSTALAFIQKEKAL